MFVPWGMKSREVSQRWHILVAVLFRGRRGEREASNMGFDRWWKRSQGEGWLLSVGASHRCRVWILMVSFCQRWLLSQTLAFFRCWHSNARIRRCYGILMRKQSSWINWHILGGIPWITKRHTSIWIEWPRHRWISRRVDIIAASVCQRQRTIVLPLWYW